MFLDHGHLLNGDYRLRLWYDGGRWYYLMDNNRFIINRLLSVFLRHNDRGNNLFFWQWYWSCFLKLLPWITHESYKIAHALLTEVIEVVSKFLSELLEGIP